MSMSRLGMILAAALSALPASVAGSAGEAVDAAYDDRRSIRQKKVNEIIRSHYGASPDSYPNGPGWTVAHVKRMARKARNVRRHKAAARRKGGRS